MKAHHDLGYMQPEEDVLGVSQAQGERPDPDIGHKVIAAFGSLLSDLAIDERDDQEDLDRARNCLRQLAAGSSQFIEVVSQALGRQESRPHTLREVS